MLSPKSMKYRKPQRGRLSGKSNCGNLVSFGEYGFQSIDSSFITSRQIEARRRVLSRYVRRNGKLWIRVFPDKAVTARASETRIGSGKGRVRYYASAIYPGKIIFEFWGISGTRARQVTRVCGSKFPFSIQLCKKNLYLPINIL